MESNTAHRSIHDDPAAASDLLHDRHCLRRCQAGSGNPPQLSQLQERRHYRLACGGGDELRHRYLLHSADHSDRIYRARRAGAAEHRCDPSDDVPLRGVDQSRPGGIQSHSHSASRRLARLQIHPATGLGAQLSKTPRPRLADTFPADRLRRACTELLVCAGFPARQTRDTGCFPLYPAQSMDDVTMRSSSVAVADPSAASEVFVVELAEYSGPLDLLLTLIRDEQIDIYDIPIARIAEQFLARISSLELDEAADYLEMAARLVRIKAQLLLPRSGDEEAWEDPRAELVRRLLEYQQVREVVEHLDRLGEDRRQRFTRGWTPAAAAMLPSGAPPLALSLGELLSAVDRVLRT